ncbi:MAG: glycine cleavage system protein GcvH [Candidatus Kapaibacterium sp.]
MNFPENLKFAKSHEWLRLEDNTAYIGVSDFAQSELGDVVFVDISVQVGDVVEAGSVFGTIEAVKTVSDLYMPVSGEIAEINQKIIDTPETVNSDPYGNGWMIRIVTEDKGANLMDSAAYADMVGQGH